jgi:hypothetical protein
MATDWIVTRTNTPRRDGQLRWDAAYQLLLRWSQATEAETSSISIHTEENKDGNRIVRPRLNPPPTNNSDH